MAPHFEGEDRSFARAFEVCERAFHQLDENRVKEEQAVEWIRKIKQSMDTEGIKDLRGLLQA